MGENLYKKIQGKLDKVNPNVKYKDVLDNNGESIEDKFNRLNHIFLDFKDNSVAKTRLQLPIERRRKGLYVSYVNSSGTPITEQYIGEDCTDSYFALNKNWSRLDSIKVDSNGKILSSYLPSYVDDVLEYDSLDKFPKIGESDKIYVTLDTDLTYRWSGSKYTEISKSLTLGETETTAFPGNRGVKLESDAINIKNSVTNINNNITNINGILNIHTNTLTSHTEDIEAINTNIGNINSNISTITDNINAYKVFQNIPLVIISPENEDEINHNKLVYSKLGEFPLCWCKWKKDIYGKSETMLTIGEVNTTFTSYRIFYKHYMQGAPDDASILYPYGDYCYLNEDGTTRDLSYGYSVITPIIGINAIYKERGVFDIRFTEGKNSEFSVRISQDSLIYDSDDWEGAGYKDSGIFGASKNDRPQICSNNTSIGAFFKEKSSIVLFRLTDENKIHITIKKYVNGGDSSEVYKEYDLATKDDLDTAMTNTAMTIRSLDIEDEE